MKKEVKINNQISLLVLSCDLYEDAWKPYFKLINRNWENAPDNCYLMTEEKTFQCDFMNVKTINTGKGMVWTDRLSYALQQIDSEYIVFSLEDYFIHEKVNDSAFLDAVKQMENNPKWGGDIFSSNKERCKLS